MSLLGPEDEFAGLAQNQGKRFLPKLNYYFLFLIIGLLAGILIQFYFISPLLQPSAPKDAPDCLEIKALLNKENQCLYSLVPDATKASEECNQKKSLLNNNKDYNEEA